MVLAEGAGIFGLVATCIGFYGAVSNGVTLIHKDIKDSKHYKTDLKTLIDKAGRQERKLKQWQEDWFVYGGIDGSFYKKLWGTMEYGTIQTQLENLKHRCDAARKEFHRVPDFNEQLQIPNPDDPATRKGLVQRIKAKGYKTWFIKTGKKEYLKNLLIENADSLDAIVQAGKDGRHRDSDPKPREVDFNLVNRFAIAHLLAPVAMEARPYTDYLWLSSHSNREVLTSELDLDIFGASHASTREKSRSAIATAAAKKRLDLTILTRPTGLVAADMNRTCVRPSSPSACAQADAWVVALGKAGSKNSDDPYPYKATEDLYLYLFKSTSISHPGGGSRKSLREIQSETQPPTFANVDLLGNIPKLRIAFELAQACFLFLLSTEWLSGLCSCRVRRGTPPDYDSEGHDDLRCDFTLLLGEVEHAPPPWAQLQWADANEVPAGCWGQANQSWTVVTNPLRRLAVLLIEVALGTTVLEATSDNKGSIVAITFAESDNNLLRRRSVGLLAVLEEVRLAVGNDMGFKNAIKFCATTQPRQILVSEDTEALLKTVYFEAVHPIKHLYGTYLDAHLRRRRELGI